MNPFSEDACCLFKIGAKKKIHTSLDDTNKNENKRSSKIARRICFASLILWIVFGIPVVMVMIPYIAYLKLIRNPALKTLNGSYLVAMAR